MVGGQFVSMLDRGRRCRAVRLGQAGPGRLRPDDGARRRRDDGVRCVNRSLKLAPASVVVPYQYTMIVWAVALGWMVFGDVPDAFTIAGAAIICAAGLYILWREQVVHAAEPTTVPPPA